ncbi:MAG: LysR family transcriptional regulator [Elusimicrobia bacterium]|nr:LysR family transcriptional regulator [Elusimicrobiota bacterium]
METFELRYFLAVAQRENLGRAAESVHVSPGSLSKAVSRLERELGTPLFFKAGRGIKLTPEGLLLKKRAAELLQLEEAVRFELAGKGAGALNLFVSSEEILQTAFGVLLAKKVDALFPEARTQYWIRPESEAVEQVLEGEAQLAMITADPPPGTLSKRLSIVNFQTCAAPGHPLVKRYGARGTIPIAKVLEHPFVSPDSAILGRISKSSSADGWRDDKFPRRIKYKAYGLKLMENLIREGLALGYLPDYFVASAGLVPLKISGCPYYCQQTVRLIVKDPIRVGWLQTLWGDFKNQPLFSIIPA